MTGLAVSRRASRSRRLTGSASALLSCRIWKIFRSHRAPFRRTSLWRRWRSRRMRRFRFSLEAPSLRCRSPGGGLSAPVSSSFTAGGYDSPGSRSVLPEPDHSQISGQQPGSELFVEVATDATSSGVSLVLRSAGLRSRRISILRVRSSKLGAGQSEISGVIRSS